MNKPIIFAITALLSSVAWAQTNMTPAVSNTPAGPKTISIKEMLVIGHSSMKLHSLAMITQGNAKGGVDETYLPGFKVCSDDPAIPVRSVTARLLGQHFVENKEPPNPEAVDLLIKLAKDESGHVSYSAVYYGLTQLQNKSPEIVELLIDVATTNREPKIYERISLSLENNRNEVVQILDGKLMEDNAIAIYEIYEDLSGQKPAKADTYLDMPSSRPKAFFFKVGGDDAEAFKTELVAELSSIGLKDIDLLFFERDKNYILKTNITRDRIAVEKTFANHAKFTITYAVWLTPELEKQISEMCNAKD